jgi:hypothetical protein
MRKINLEDRVLISVPALFLTSPDDNVVPSK